MNPPCTPRSFDPLFSRQATADEARERYDPLRQFAQLWRMLSEAPALAERLNRDVVPMVLTWIDTEYELTVQADGRAALLEPQDDTR